MTMGIVLVAFLGGPGRMIPRRNDDINLEMHQLGRKGGKPIQFSICVSIFNDDVFSLNVAEIAQTLPECLGAGRMTEAGTVRYPIRGIFVGCCASATAQQKAMQQESNNTAPDC